MAKLIQEMIINYNEENLKDLDKHIENPIPRKQVEKMVVKHNGPTKVTLTEESARKCAEIILK